jgi:hypothetical protein
MATDLMARALGLSLVSPSHSKTRVAKGWICSYCRKSSNSSAGCKIHITTVKRRFALRPPWLRLWFSHRRSRGVLWANSLVSRCSIYFWGCLPIFLFIFTPSSGVTSFYVTFSFLNVMLPIIIISRLIVSFILSADVIVISPFCLSHLLPFPYLLLSR